MVGSLKESKDESVKKGAHENPVDACKGWFGKCDYCDKRFCEWAAIDEDIYEKIPDKPGFLMIALKNKNTKEIVSILYNHISIRKQVTTDVSKIKEQISNKRSKTTKSVMLIRWMIIKKPEDKENSILCAHWYNNGVLPKFSTSWPGQRLMRESGSVELSKQSQTWCYQRKDPVWRKSKPSSKYTEVQKCNFESCDICDSYFTPWQPLDDVIEKGSAPHDDGVVMLSAVYGKSREVLLITNSCDEVLVSINPTVKLYDDTKSHFLSDVKYKNMNVRLEVRWAILKDVYSDYSCFLFAHWGNSGKRPKLDYFCKWIFGEDLSMKNANFVFLKSCKQWLYKTEAIRPLKSSKAKTRRELLDELNAEEYET